jgi:hypothetical protein
MTLSGIAIFFNRFLLESFMNPKLCWRISNHDLSLTNPENSDRISLLQNELLIAQLCDGSRNVTTIIETYEAQSGETMPMEDLLAFLDQLSDKGALATRIAPPQQVPTFR